LPPGGGCVLPVFAKQKRGQDCTAIINALDVSCINSICVVHACRDGFVVSDDESTCLPVLILEGRDTTAADTVAGNVSVDVDGLAPSVGTASTFATKVVPRQTTTSASTLSLGAADTVLDLDPKALVSLLAAADPFAVLTEAYSRAHSKRETNPIPITPSTSYAATGIEGLVLVDGPY
jgi:hypothetical protein